ncbi:helix-turn-helix transcriptional regulator [Deinococcus sp. Marseille-Q6407]|uniref:helix-turn-helix transcriptional regulator n=1 Tax=Deinococcus sp. Marseille-Q6407 TaxID=2969223 RepID=UPI0021BF2517|nr:winged helix-turn-helix transcriptional regulator [Deinococcus sp. Marseille-Q6407]
MPAGAKPAERTSDRLLALLKQQGAQCAGQLSERLGLTEQGVRRHLSRLTADGLIEARTERPLGRGRPQQVYLLTEQGEARFPKSYPSLCVDILSHLQVEYGAEAVERVMNSRARTAIQKLRADWDPGLTLEQRLEQLTQQFQNAGYGSVKADEGDAYTLTHCNCPHLAVAREFNEVCLAEQVMIADALETEVTCESRASSGGCQCRYRISKSGPAEAASRPDSATTAGRPERF